MAAETVLRTENSKKIKLGRMKKFVKFINKVGRALSNLKQENF